MHLVLIEERSLAAAMVESIYLARGLESPPCSQFHTREKRCLTNIGARFMVWRINSFGPGPAFERAHLQRTPEHAD